VDLQGKTCDKLLQVVILLLEVFDLLAGGISDRIPGETLFLCFHELFGPGIEGARLDSLPPAEVTNRDLPSETLQNDADLVFRGVFPAGPGPDLPDESLDLWGLDLCYVGLTGVVLGHFRLLSRCGRSIPCTGSPNTPPPSWFSPFKSAPLSLNAYRYWDGRGCPQGEFHHIILIL